MRFIISLLTFVMLAKSAAPFQVVRGGDTNQLKWIAWSSSKAGSDERYFNGDTASTLHDIRSATKSITALLMGIAIQRGLVHSVNDPSLYTSLVYLPTVEKR